MALAMQTQQQEFPERWNRALQRALDEGLDVLTEPVSGQTFVESALHPGTLYHVTVDHCSCAAGARGLPCKHRACLLAQMGILPLDPDPVDISSMEGGVDHARAVIDCAACNGCGSVYSRSGGWACDYCQGRGRVPA